MIGGAYNRNIIGLPALAPVVPVARTAAALAGVSAAAVGIGNFPTIANTNGIQTNSMGGVINPNFNNVSTSPNTIPNSANINGIAIGGNINGIPIL